MNQVDHLPSICSDRTVVDSQTLDRLQVIISVYKGLSIYTGQTENWRRASAGAAKKKEMELVWNGYTM